LFWFDEKRRHFVATERWREENFLISLSFAAEATLKSGSFCILGGLLLVLFTFCSILIVAFEVTMIGKSEKDSMETQNEKSETEQVRNNFSIHNSFGCPSKIVIGHLIPL
jgi:hypothetical protein